MPIRPANYLKITSRSDYIENRRGIGIYQNSHLFQSLPAKAEFDFLDRSDIRILNEGMRSLSAQLLSTTTPKERHRIQIKQKLAYRNKQRLYKEELKRLRSSSLG
ncbi:uncharacterized protein N7458_009199 [Penicillium daleae]|uniref:Uncharacterized protein n=1 Tax=Penicillium daleae TaxID=63821 RepID=A0AAD6BYQ9_9EURO|nr:uncharacterized protein N7458_009199 [Penicillium daleae]KAJ5438201.1 hypothetical protein N7458_009199 [Penicillium daleae]